MKTRAEVSGQWSVVSGQWPVASGPWPVARAALRRLIPALAVTLMLAGHPAQAAGLRTPQSPREFYNEGTQRFQEGKLRDAEGALQTAVASHNEKVQPVALYNLGLVRFQQGADALKEAPKAGPAKARGDAACAQADRAIKAADAALAGNEVDAIVRAYLQGRGARKELKAATEAVRKAMEAHGAVLSRWQRSSGDFKSAAELRPSLTDARANAEIVDRHIVGLVDQQEMMQLAMACMDGKKTGLKGRMAELKKRLPDGQQPGPGEDDEDDDDDKPLQDPKQGSQEKDNKDGKEMALTWEEAVRLLESLKLDKDRKLSMGDQDTAKPKDRKGKDW
jgi:tetratricopeptide (TPR) repeat protein